MFKVSQNAFLLAAIFILSVNIYAQNRFEGYSLTVEANEDGACPVRWLPSAGGGNAVDVFVAGTNLQTRATGLTACDESSSTGNRINPNGLGKWCFSGAEPMYEIKLQNGVTYLWPALTKESGIYNVKDFRPVRRALDNPVKYVFSEPADYTKTVKNAIAYIAARQGGTLRFPDGDYIVGTTDGSTRDPSYQAITIPSGVVVEGSGANASIPSSNMPYRTTSARIRLKNDNQTIFRIGGCTNQVTIKNIELLGNDVVYGETLRGSNVGTVGIEGLGKWAIDPVTKQHLPNSTQFIRFENLTIQNFDKGIFVHNVNERNCKPAEQACDQWQFDYVRVDQLYSMHNKTGIWINTFNTDWQVNNTFFAYTSKNAPGDGIRLQKTGSMLLQQTWGGGYDRGANIGGTFLYIDYVGGVTIINSGAENGKRSIYTNPAGGVSSTTITVINSGFGDPVELRGRLNYVSSGTFYQPNTITADPTVTITSTGDRFCYDPYSLPGRCKDSSGRNVLRPNYSGGRIMFQTGAVADGKDADKIEGRPNLFGYNVEIRDGLMQYDPNVNFKLINDWASGADGRPPVKDGAFVYCNDCRGGNICSQGTARTDGAFAKRINGQWHCD
ncbi:MAG: hypothetical protein WBD16_05440 [Pyrinomonadaceae bacterium]